MNNKMINVKSWKEFRDSGMLWFVNTILHAFGWAITIEVKNDEIVDVRPARVKFRGFSEDTNTDGYIKISQYMKDNIDDILKEAKS